MVVSLSEFVLALKGFYHELFHEEFVDIVWDTIISMLGYIAIWMVSVL